MSRPSEQQPEPGPSAETDSCDVFPTNVHRRDVLAATLTASGLALTGCLSDSDDSEEIPTLELDESELLAVADIDVPERPDLLPVDVKTEHVVSGQERVRSLLAPIPEDLTDEIPNQRVRTEIDEYRDDAQQALESSENATDPSDALSAVRSARRDGATAEGIYAVATKDYSRDDVFEWAADVRTELDSVEDSLERTGDDVEPVVFVYEQIERWLRSARDAVTGHIERIAPAASEVEAVREATRSVEMASAQLDDATHLQEQMPSATVFDETLQASADTLVEERRDRAAELPEERTEFVDLGIGGVSSDPVDTLLRLVRRDVEYVSERIEDGQVAWAARQAHRFVLRLETIDGIEARFEGEQLEVPDSADDVETVKREAIQAVKPLQENVGNSTLFDAGFNEAVGYIRNGDSRLERIQEDDLDVSESLRGSGYVFSALLSYRIAIEIANVVPNVTETVADVLETAAPDS